MNAFNLIFKGIFTSNPVFVLALGLCSTLAVTSRLDTAFFMGVMVAATTIFSSTLISTLRYKIPFSFRLMSYMLLIISAVITIEQLLKAYHPDMARTLGQYVGLMVTNCIVMGHCESFGVSHPPKETFYDALGVSLGYLLVLLCIAAPRELLGNGTLWGLAVAPEGYIPCQIFNSPPGAFIIFVALLTLVNSVKSAFKGGKV
jgi:Na+-transporting NADH:ubiquinone oxidoreductase subunit D